MNPCDHTFIMAGCMSFLAGIVYDTSIIPRDTQHPPATPGTTPEILPYSFVIFWRFFSRVCMYVCMWRSQDSLSCFSSVTVYLVFWDMIFLWHLQLSDYTSPGGQLALRILCFYHSSVWVTIMPQHTGFIYVDSGFGFRSWCLQGSQSP